jgi:hypothetical protein
MKQYFYVYRITIDKKYHYYGARSTNVIPSEDLGIHYFSSSIVVKNALTQSKPVKYKIIKETETFEEALEIEVLLHHRFDVENHPLFLNRRNQTSTKFIHGTKNKIAVYNPADDVVEYIPCSKLDLFITLGYKKGLPESKVNWRKSRAGTFLGRKHNQSTKDKLCKKKSINIQVQFKDGTKIEFENRLKLGQYLGMSPQLGARLVRESHRKDLWDKYNIKDIVRL